MSRELTERWFAAEDERRESGGHETTTQSRRPIASQKLRVEASEQRNRAIEFTPRDISRRERRHSGSADEGREHDPEGGDGRRPQGPPCAPWPAPFAHNRVNTRGGAEFCGAP
jgi:hypothetical protein